MDEKTYINSKFYLTIITDEYSPFRDELECLLKRQGLSKEGFHIDDKEEIAHLLIHASEEVQCFILETRCQYEQTGNFDWELIKRKAHTMLQKLDAAHSTLPLKTHKNVSNVIERPNLYEEAKVIKASEILILVRCKTNIIYEAFKSENMGKMAFDFMKKQLTEREFVVTNPKKVVYDDKIVIEDEYGLWMFNRFFGVISITIYRIQNIDMRKTLHLQLVDMQHTIRDNSEFLESVLSHSTESVLSHFPAKWKLENPELLEIENQFVYILTNNHPTVTNENIESHSLESFLICVAETNKKPAATAQSWLKILKSEDIESVEDIFSLDERGWSKLSNKLSAKGAQLIRKEIDSRKISKRMQETFNSCAYNMSLGHRLRRFFHYELNKEGQNFKSLPDLDVQAVDEAFMEVGKKFKGPKLLKSLQENFFQPFCVEKSKNMDTQRGLLLYGPPGTGKTMLTDELPQKMGLTPVSFPISAPEVNRSLVGQTERVISALFDRARQMPHLLCCIAIDEIDRLAPKRDQKSGEHKSDVLCMLLSLIGGAKDVPNLIVLASTNLLNKIDEAFRRRMSGQFFVGRPDSETRLQLLKRIDEDAPGFLSKKEYDLLQEVTVNFTGAALKSVNTTLITEYKLRRNKGKILNSKDLRELIFEKCIRKSRQFNIFVGKEILADVLRKIDKNENGGITVLPLSDPRRFTGKILIDCMQCEVQIELSDKVPIAKEILEKHTKIRDKAKEHREYGYTKLETVSFKGVTASMLDASHILPCFAKLVNEQKIEYVQLIDQNLLRANAAFDESAVAEVWQEKMQEFQEYSRVLFILDLDSLASMNLSTSESGMGSSTSLSIANTKLFNYVIDAMKMATIDPTQQKWVVTMVSNDKLKDLFLKTIYWPLSIEGIEEEIEKMKREEEKQCVRCWELYLEKDSNNYTSCIYHETSFMIEKIEKGQGAYSYINRGRMEKSDAEEDIFRRGIKSENLVYVCCMQPFGSAGCKKNKHSDKKNDWDAYCLFKDNEVYERKANKFK